MPRIFAIGDLHLSLSVENIFRTTVYRRRKRPLSHNSEDISLNSRLIFLYLKDLYLKAEQIT